VIECFLVTSAERARVSLRRYHESSNVAALKCASELGYHNAQFYLGEYPQALDPIERVWRPPVVETIPHTDERWPVKCEACDYRFALHDEWQVFNQHLYVDAQGGEHTLWERKPGMMWFAPWYYDPTDPGDVAELPNRRQKKNSYLGQNYWRDWASIRAPLSVICPGGSEWCVDAESSNNDGVGWLVSGAAPKLSCTPSIVVPGYHGYLGSQGAPPGWFSNPL
jgi:hypothetical protein